MRLLNRFLLGAVFAASTASLAVAESPSPAPSSPSGEPAAFASVIETRLHDEVEKSAAELGGEALGGLAGPSSMRCSHMLTKSDLETCVVTTDGAPEPAMPAALAQH